jgi:hypothetical protein
MTAEIIKLPYNVTRGAFSRKPRRSKNGTPEERAAKATDPAASSLTSWKPVRQKRVITGDKWDEFVSIVGPDLQQAFMVDAWKLINRYMRKL